MPVAFGTAGALAAWLEPFTALFTRPTWRHVLALVAGAVLTPNRRTVTAALRATGHDRDPGFARHHRVLSRNRWSALACCARCLLGLLVAAFSRNGPVVVGLDDTLERRWGARIRVRGIYRDPVRSSHGH